MSQTREYVRQLVAYIDHRLRRPRRLDLGGSTGEDGGGGIPPGGISGQLPQKYVAYDTTEAASSGSTWTAGSKPSLVQNLNRIRGGYAIADDAIRERHLLWSTGSLSGTSGSISAVNVPFFTTSDLVSSNVRDAIEEVRSEGSATRYVMDTYLLAYSGVLKVESIPLVVVTTGCGPIDHVYLRCAAAPDGADIIVDVNKNGTTIFTDQNKRPRIPDGGTSGSSVPDITELMDNDELTVDIDQIGSTSPGESLTVHIRRKQEVKLL